MQLEGQNVAKAGVEVQFNLAATMPVWPAGVPGSCWWTVAEFASSKSKAFGAGLGTVIWPEIAVKLLIFYQMSQSWNGVQGDGVFRNVRAKLVAVMGLYVRG